jgi:hypothetical protein
MSQWVSHDQYQTRPVAHLVPWLRTKETKMILEGETTCSFHGKPPKKLDDWG